MNPMIIAAMVAVVGGVVGSWLKSSGDAKERKQREEALEAYAALQPPKVQQMIAREVAGSRMADVATDEGLEANQDEAQERLMARGRGEQSLGLRASQEQARINAAREAQGSREAVLASARARGTAGSGEELLLQQDANQAAAETERMAGIQSLADEDQAALQALIAGGNMAGQRQQADFDRQAAVAGAQDDIAMFNAGQFNQFTLENARQRQQDFENRMALTDRRVDMMLGLGAHDRRAAYAQGEAIAGAAQSASGGIAGMGGKGGAPAGAAGAAGKTGAPQQMAKAQPQATQAKQAATPYYPQTKRRLG